MKTQNIIQPLRNHLKPLALAVTAGVLLMSHTPARAVEVAGTLLIDLHYTTGITTVVDGAAPSETRVESWANFGTMGGAFVRSTASPYGSYGISTYNPPFMADKGGITVPNAPSARCLISTVATPAALSGANPWTMEIWFWANAQANDARKFFAWTENLPDDSKHAGKFGHGPYGAQNAGSQGIISPPDMLWDPTKPTTGVSAGVWHHGVVTYDGTTEKIYLDGVLVNTQTVALDISPLTYYPIIFSGLVEATPAATSFSMNGAIAALRVHSGVLSAAQVLSNNNDGASATTGVTYSISGTVSTYNTSDPVGALVALKVGANVVASQTVPTSGAYSFNVPPGTYTVRASKAGYLPDQSGDIIVTTSGVTEDLLLAQDATAPLWTSGWPMADSVGSTSFSARANLDEVGTAYYVVVADGASPAPTPAQVKAGLNGGGTAAIKSGSISVTAPNTEFSAAVTGLAQNSFFDVYFVAEDPAVPPNLQATTVKRDIATLGNLYTESFVGGTHGEQLSVSPVGWEANYKVLIQINSATPDGDNTYASKWQTDSGRMPVSTKVGEYTIPAASRIGTAFTVDFAAQQTGGMRFFAWVGGVRYGSDKFANVDATNGQFGSGSAVTTWATKSYSVESSNWYLMPSDLDELISTTPVLLPPGDITQFGVYWNNQGNDQQWAIDNFRVDATPASLTYAWDGGAGNWADSNWTFGGVPAQAPATGFHMFINGGGTVAVADDFSALSVNVGQTGTAGSLTVNSTKTLGATQLYLGSDGTLQVGGTLTAPAVISNGTAAISSTGVVNASSLVQIVAGSLTSASGSQLNIGTGTLMLSGGTGATLDGLLSINGGTVTLNSGTLTYNHVTNATPAVLAYKGGTLAGTGLVIPTVRYEVTNQTISGLTGGAGLVAESGTVILSGTNDYSGTTEIRCASTSATYLRVADASLLSPGNLYFNSPGRFQQDAFGRPATLETKGTLARNIGTGAGEIRFVDRIDEKSAIGFAAVGGPLSVNLNSGATLIWSSATTGLNNSWLMLGSPNADNVVTLVNPLQLTAVFKTDVIYVFDNLDSPNDHAIVQGAISGSFPLIKDGPGTLTLKGINTYNGSTTVSSGTLILDVAAQLKFVIPATSGGNKTITGAGTVVLNGDFYIDTALTDANAGLTTGTWQLENVPSLTTAYGTSFRVVDASSSPWGNTGDQWTKTVGTKLYTFNETDGTLTLSEAPTTGYAVWANANGVSLIPSEDSNNDGVANGVAYFMNKTGLATNPAINGTTKQVTWPNGGKIDSDQYGIQFVVQTSSDLQTWTDVLVGDPNLINTSAVVSPPSDGELSYTLTGTSPRFVRLKVTPN